MLKPMPFEGRRPSWRRPGRATFARLTLGAVSLAIYLALSLLHNQNSDDAERTWLAYDIERSAMASATSNIVYGAPLASVYSGVLDEFLRPTGSPEEIVDKVKSKKIKPGDLIPYNPDGLGAGEAIFATVSMRIFGVHVSSVLWSFLTLMTIAVVAFLVRFPDNRALVAVAALSALILMFASRLGTTAENISQIPVGGYRYFSLLAAIPGMHVFLELISNERASSERQTTTRWLLLLVQLGIFAIALYVNIAAIYLCGPFTLGSAYAVYHLRRDQAAREMQLHKIIVIIGLVGAALVASRAVAPHGYKESGRSGDMIWSRLFVALGANPHWPFGTLAEEYKGCWPEEPEKTLGPGIQDFNLSCAWSKYTERHHISRDDMAQHLYDDQYNRVLKDVFLKVARQYPVEMLLTFVYYKPLMLRDTLLSLFDFTNPMPGWAALLVATQFLVLFAFAIVEAQSLTGFATVAISLALGAISTCGLYIVAWSNTWNTGDLFLYLLALLSVAVVALLTAAVRLLLYSGQKVFGAVYAEGDVI